MSRSDLTRRRVLKSTAVIGVTTLTSWFPTRSAHAADLTVGVVYIGHRNDFGWNQSHALAADALRAVPNVRVVEAGYLPESTDYTKMSANPQTRAYADAMERMITAHGAQLIISTAFGTDAVSSTMEKKYPDVQFRHSTALGSDDSPKNAGSENVLINQGHYVNGVAAGLCTTSNKLGFVAGETDAPVLLNINSFMLGIRQTNPDATVHAAFTREWTSPTRETRVTNALVDAGCDVITCHVDAPKVIIQTAEDRGVKTCGHAFNQTSLAPKGYITGAEYKWISVFEKFAEMLQKGETLPKFVIGGYDKNYALSSPFGTGANPKAINAAQAAILAMKNNDAIFVGPIKDNTGKLMVPAGTTYGPYASELQKTNYLIEGVIGSIT